MEDAVEDGGGEGAVVVEDLRPVFVGAVGGDDHGGALVTLADDLEQQVGAVLVDGQVAEFVDDEKGGLEIAGKFALEAAGGLGGGQRVDDVYGGGEEDGVSIQAGGVAQRDRQMRLAEADTSRDILPGIRTSAEFTTRFTHDAVKRSLLFGGIVFKAQMCLSFISQMEHWPMFRAG
jgi:hypothetical protein